MASKKLKLLYLADYLRRETDEQHPATMQDIMDELARWDITAERKSIYDDLHLLEDYGMDIQTVKGKNFGYYLGERDFQLPELKMLVDVVQASPFLTQRKSMELIAKLEKLASRHQARAMRRQVYVMSRPRTLNEQLYYAVDGINTAINENKKISFRYFDWGADGTRVYRRGGQRYVIDPVALCVEKHYYLVAYDSREGKYRNYRLDRMEGLQVEAADRAPLPAGFDLGQYAKSMVDMFSGETATVTLGLDKGLLNAALDRFGTDCHVRPDGDRVMVTATVDISPTLYGWVFQFGERAEIIGPEAVRQDFAHYLRRVQVQYKEAE